MHGSNIYCTPIPPQTMVTPLTQKYFNYGELENSVMYCLCGVEVIAGFLFVRWLSQRVAERVVLAIGLTICNISCIWCLIFLANPLGQSTQHLRKSLLLLLHKHTCILTRMYIS